MQAYENGTCRIIDGGINAIFTSFSLVLMDAITYYRDFGLSGKEMLIVFSDEEEKIICDSARELLSNRCSQPNEPKDVQDKMLFAKALQAMISTIPVNSLETLRLCTYIKSVGGKTEGRRIGILYHSFSTLHRDEKGTSFTINPIEFTMTV